MENTAPGADAGAGQDRFLTRPLSTVLDFVRFASAFLVVLGHAVQLQLWAGPFPFDTRMQHYCVVVFFVLSGLVISTSVIGRRSGLGAFSVSRLSRIAPVAVPSVLFSTLAAYVLAGPHRVLIDNSPDDLIAIARQVLIPMAFVSARPEFAGPVWNPPYWSLCYEVWFYILFAFAWYLRGWQRVVAMTISALCAGPTILMLGPVWMMGAALTHVPTFRRVPGWLAPCVLAACAAAGWWVLGVDQYWKVLLRGRTGFNLSWSEWMVSDLAMGAIVALAFAALRPMSARVAPLLARLAPLASVSAGFSFTLYLFHWPLLELAQSWGLGHLHNVWAFAALLAAILAVCFGISRVTEHQSPRLRRWISARIDLYRGPAPLAA